jgi:ABC-type polysaccharide/polyol phosphate export permease
MHCGASRLTQALGAAFVIKFRLPVLIDKPLSMFVFNLVGFTGVPILLVAFVAVWFNVPYAFGVFFVLFFTCWLTCAVCWLGYVSGKLSGKYRNITPRPWREQVW